MADKFASMRNLKFLLYEVFDVESLTRHPRYQDHGREIFDMVLDAGFRLSRDVLRPCLSEMDKAPPELVDGRVRVHPAVQTLMRACGEGGWIGAHASYARGGQQLPAVITTAFRFLFSAANYSAGVFPFLTSGAAHLLESFGSEELIDTYLPRMFAGRWQGTMALTEPQAGSSLSDIATTAYPAQEGGFYRLKGQKIFISCADHDGVENVVNLLLARIQGAPAGVKGISLFVVPKRRLREDGTLEDNDIVTTAVYHKLGYRGAPLTQLSLGEAGDCRGWLVGEANQGLRYMFQLMNEARIEVGMGAAAIASAAYYASLAYARERPQGRKIASKDPWQPQIPIIEHADVKRMLLFQRAVVEGALSLLFQCALYVDRASVLEGEEKDRCALLLDLLTPVAKTYPSEMGVLSVSAGLQCLGGYGYCDEFPLEQYWRDARIHPIHEGTTTIQGMDLLGRKVVMKDGRAFLLFLDEAGGVAAAAEGDPELAAEARNLRGALDKLKDVTGQLTGMALEGKIELFLADASLYLEMFGIVAVAWQWLLQARKVREALSHGAPGADADFYRGKLLTFRYFFRYELPKIEGLYRTLTEPPGVTVEMTEALFRD